MDITFLYWEECMSHEEALQRVRQVMAEEGVQTSINIVKDHYLRAALDAVLGIRPLSVATTQPQGCTIKWK